MAEPHPRNTMRSSTTGDLPSLDWLEVLNPGIHLGHVRHALFDFDGTISVIRRGWEMVMIPLMIEMICDGQPATPEIVSEVEEYVDRSTGILTIKQMQWLEDAVRRHGIAQAPRTAREYKQIYNEQLLRPVRQRMGQVGADQAARDRLMMAGARSFVHGLQERNVSLYLASGTDHTYVLEEAQALGVSELFGDHIYGAQDDTEAYTKERIIARILDENHLSGEQLMVAGDGPVEIRHAKACGAIALGVASDEEMRSGLNPRKRQRLLYAGADLIVADFVHYKDLLSLLLDARMPEGSP